MTATINAQERELPAPLGYMSPGDVEYIRSRTAQYRGRNYNIKATVFLDCGHSEGSATEPVFTADHMREYAQAARRAPRPAGHAEPVAWGLLEPHDQELTNDPVLANYWKRKGRKITPLFAAPVAAEPAVEAPDLAKPSKRVVIFGDSMIERQLIVGKFYMVVITNDPDTTTDWECKPMPARFAGYDDKGLKVWNFLDPEPREWPVTVLGMAGKDGAS
ncbi:hypothetical protein [Massilia sp. CCM 8734]|uniref:hypothetical protein n=1 Tax=Massilia sp. CCM 8734 TaxID=2609283 RepID=UPI00141D9464|nr:hypothetical protein [Massilia sp. CCM 8734]NHZ94633.1 hypothetical protein [Massilia sp. CCM 8734]